MSSHNLPMHPLQVAEALKAAGFRLSSAEMNRLMEQLDPGGRLCLCLEGTVLWSQQFSSVQ